MKPEDYAKKLNAAGTITRFMGYLATRHTALQMRYLWRAMDAMIDRYGTVFVADEINKDPNDAMWALWNYKTERSLFG